LKRRSNNLILLLLFQISGILIAHYSSIDLPHLLIAFCAFVLCFYLYPSLFWMAFGFFTVVLSAHHTKAFYPKKILNTTKDWRVFYIEEEQSKAKQYYKYKATFQKHKVLLFSKTPLTENAYYLAFTGLKEVENFNAAFDYKTYLAKSGIRYQTWISSAHFLFVSTTTKTRIKQYLKSLWKKHLPERLVGFTQTLLLGDKKDLDPLLLGKFQQAGLAHILAISGMHIGLLFLMLERITFWFERTLKLLVVLGVLWSYVVLLGFSPSASRAVLGISIWLLLKYTYKWTSAVHILLLSAFISLCFNPYLIFDVGFQFSYSAVLGILLFYPLFNEKLQLKNSVLQKIMQLLLISFCAQLSVLPLSLYYFHQFPSFFLFSNLLASPLLPLVLFTGIGITFFPSLTWVYRQAVELLFQIVAWFADQCWSLFYVFQIEKIQVIAMYLILYQAYLYFHFHSKNELYSLYIPKKIGPWYQYFYLKCKQKPLLYIIRGVVIVLITVLFSERLPLVY